MPLEERDAAYIGDMITYARRVVRVVCGLDMDTYLADEDRQAIVERYVEVVGEAANRTSADARARYPGVPWRTIIGQRHVLAHDYGRIDHRRLWEVATVFIPQLLEQIDPPPPPVVPSPWSAS